MDNKEQKKTSHRCAYIGWIGLAIISAVLVWNHLKKESAKESAIELALEWARLEHIPLSAKDVTVILQGNMFSREIWVFFSADFGDVNDWVDSSDGFRDALTNAVYADEIVSNGVKMLSAVPRVTHYAITPGGGAQFAEAMVFFHGDVIIHAYWS